MAQRGLFIVVSLLEGLVVLLESFKLEDSEEAIDELVVLGETFFAGEVDTVDWAESLDLDEFVPEW